MSENRIGVVWIVLTMGDRAPMLLQALKSILDKPYMGSTHDVIVVSNGAGALELGSDGRVRVALSDSNLGVPAGRDFGLGFSDAALVGFLDDDAELRGHTGRIVEAFEFDPRLGAISMRLVDENGRTARRHIPKAGGKAPDVGSDIAYFLGGACVIRRSAYEEVGGYFTELFYGHEEIELSWRLIDAGWSIRYLADVEVFHPRTEISRHAEGWIMTGRNRVWIARRTLPWPVALVHVTLWLVIGAARAPKGDCRSGYLRGWWSGWRGQIEHRPIRWSTVWKLSRLGRPPVI